MMPMEEKLLALFAQLSRSSERNRLHAMRAKKDDRPELAHLFLALAESQAMQAQRFLMQIRGRVEKTDENEQSVFQDELPGAIELYEQLCIEAEQKDYTALSTGFSHSARVNRLLLKLYDRVKQQNPAANYYVCDFCGYVATETPPENCPICTAPQRRFMKVEKG